MRTPGRAWTAVVCAGLVTVAGCGGQNGEQAVASTSATSLTTGVTAPPLTTGSVAISVPTVDSGKTSITPSSAAETSPPIAPEPATTTAPPTVTAPDPTTSQAMAPPPAATSTPSTVPTVSGSGDGTVVVLDAGHNGRNGANPSIINAQVDAGFGATKPCNTTGTETNDGYPEHAFTWEVTNRVKVLLEAAGVTVVMTRDSDSGVGPCVNERAAIGNRSDADAVVSIHGDGAASGDRGFYAMTSERLPNGSAVGTRSLTLAGSVRDALVAARVAPSNYVGSDGLWKRDDLAGLNLSMVPTTMIEMGNMRDAEDAALMKSDAGQDRMAAGIAQGILNYLANH